jgi:peroxiredoxin
MKQGDKIPYVNFKVRSLGEFIDTNTDTYFKDKKVILFGLPGAFTPTCSNQQLPGFDKLSDVFKEHGIDDIYCISVNDSFVMNAWADNKKIQNVKFIPDGNGEFTKQVDMLADMSIVGFGMRSLRYAAIINNGTVEVLFEEPKDVANSYGVSSPENVLKYLQSINQGNNI